MNNNIQQIFSTLYPHLGTYWGKLITMEGEYLRCATQKEYEESLIMNFRYGTMGYIPISMADDGGEEVTVYACVIGGPIDEDNEY